MNSIKYGAKIKKKFSNFRIFIYNFRTPGSHGQDVMKSTFADVECPEDVASWEDNNLGNNQITCQSTTTTTTPTTVTTTVPTTVPFVDFECGPRIKFDGFTGGNEYLNGLWTLAMTPFFIGCTHFFTTNLRIW